jgi:forkhead box protein K
MFEEQEARAATSATGGGKDSKVGGRKGKSTTAGTLEPPLKRSVRGEPKGTPLPPPLTSAPLAFKREAASPLAQGSAAASTVKADQTTRPRSPGHTDSISAQSTHTLTAPSIPPIPASVILPIIVGPVPASHPSASASSSAAEGASSSAPHLSTPPIVLHENQLILNPTIFSHLTPAQLRELEALGAQKALEILQGHIVRFLKERIKTEGRTRGRGRGKRTRGTASGNTGTQAERKEKPPPPPGTALFTTAPLPLRSAPPPPMDALLPTPSPSGASDVQAEADANPPSPIVVVDDDEPPDEGPASKRRRLDMEDVTVPVTPPIAV